MLVPRHWQQLHHFRKSLPFCPTEEATERCKNLSRGAENSRHPNRHQNLTNNLNSTILSHCTAAMAARRTLRIGEFGCSL